mgnify:CR=1 FL=1
MADLRPRLLLCAIGCLLIGTLVEPHPFAHAGANIQVFKKLPVLQCSACEAMAQEIGRRMNVTALRNGGTKILASHRLEENAKHHKKQANQKDMHDPTRDEKSRYVDYEASEVRATEVLDSICPDVATSFHLARLPNGVRIWQTPSPTGEPLVDAPVYSKSEEKSGMFNPKPLLQDFCEEVLDGFDELLVAAIRRERRLDGLVRRMCENGLKLCVKDEIAAAAQEEMRRSNEFSTLYGGKLPFGKADNSWLPGSRRQRLEESRRVRPLHDDL